MDTVRGIARTFAQEYKKTPSKIKILDAFAVYALATAALQFIYMRLVGSFPFNAFLAGFLACIGFFVLTVCLRLQLDKQTSDFKDLAPERALADYVLCNCALFLGVWNFIG